MLSTRWEPRGMWSQLNRMREEMEELFGNGARRFGAAAYPLLNLWEDGDTLYVEAELPGFALDDLEITVNGDSQLSLKGQRQLPELEGGSWHRRERGYGSFSRTIELPLQVDRERVTAELKHGVLTIALGKKEEVKPRRIEVKAS